MVSQSSSVFIDLKQDVSKDQPPGLLDKDINKPEANENSTEKKPENVPEKEEKFESTK